MAPLDIGGLHFIAGLPRSGSTLLAAILRQNPAVVAGMTSPVATLYRAMEDAMARRQETSIFIDDETRRRVLRGVFAAYYGGAWGHRLIFDTGRMWCARMAALAELFPDARVICCVRSLGWIMDSFERVHRSNPFEASGVYGFDTGGTVYSRTACLAGGGGVVGFALNALREACASAQADRLLLVEYDDLCRFPEETMARLYAHIGAPAFAHDFEVVEYSAGEFDAQLGARGLHDVRGRVEVRERRSILPPDLFASFDNDQFWRQAWPAPSSASSTTPTAASPSGRSSRKARPRTL